MYSENVDLAQVIATFTAEYRIAAIKYIEYLAQAQKSKAKATLHEIQSMFSDNKGWNNESEMLEDMAKFRRVSFSKISDVKL